MKLLAWFICVFVCKLDFEMSRMLNLLARLLNTKSRRLAEKSLPIDVNGSFRYQTLTETILLTEKYVESLLLKLGSFSG